MPSTSLVFIDGELTHAVRRNAIFDRTTDVRHEADRVDVADDERLVALAALEAAGAKDLLYARVDLIRDDDGQPRLMELELTEPCLFFQLAPEAAQKMAEAILRLA